MRAGDAESNPGPKTRHLGHSKKEEDFDDILKGVASRIPDNTKIDTLGKFLAFDPAEIERYIATNSRGQHVTYEGTLKMLRDWRYTQTEATERPALADALRRAGLLRLADSFLRTPTFHTLQTTPDDLPRDDLLRSVVKDIKRYYKLNMCTIQADPTNNDVMFEFNHIYTDPTLLVEDRNNKETRKPLSFCNLIKTEINGQSPNRLLVQGGGGAGKTTFCSKIAWDWANDLGFQQFKLVAVIPFRKAKNKTVGEVIKSYLSDNNPFTAVQIDEYILSNQEEVFLVFDGLDELLGKLSDRHQINRIIHNLLFMSGMVLVTSRQWRADEICSSTELKKVYAFIYLEGFSVDNVAAYITKFFHQDAASSKQLIHFINSNDVIADNMAPFPIFIAMMCIMWRESNGKRRDAMSKLMTFSQVFDEMVDFLVDHCGSKDYSLTGLTVEEFRQMIPIHLKAIGKIAFQGILDRRLEFPEDTFQSCRGSMEVGCTVGVLTRDKHATPRCDRRENPGLQMSMVQFPHKLFQEFMAAKYLASLHSSDHGRYERIMADILVKKKEFRCLLYFTSAQGSELGLDIVKRLIEQYNSFTSSTFCYKHDHVTHFIIDVAYESQNKTVAEKVWNQFMRSRKILDINLNWSARTVSGYMFIKDHLSEVDSLVLRNAFNRTASQDLAEFILSTASLRTMKIGKYALANGFPRYYELPVQPMHSVFYSMLVDKVQQCQIERFIISNACLSKHPSESRDLAQFICKLPQLQSLELDHIKLHKDFYKTAQSMASSAKIQKLDICCADLHDQPLACRDMAEFICQMPHLESLELSSIMLHEDFFSKWASIVSSAKGNNRSTAPHTSLRELKVEYCMLVALQRCGDMFDSVEKLSIQCLGDFKFGFIQSVHGFQGVTELSIINTDGYNASRYKRKPSTMIKHIVRIFPQLIMLTFDIPLNYKIVVQILESLRETRGLPLKSVRIGRMALPRDYSGAYTLGALVDRINDENVFTLDFYNKDM